MPVSQLGAQTSKGFKVFTANGSFTPSFTGTVYVTMIGGGQCGGSISTQAGNSGYFHYKEAVAVTQGVPQTVTVGTGGSGTPLQNGTHSVFGALSTSTGYSIAAVAAMPGAASAFFEPFGRGGDGSTGAGKPGIVIVEW